MSRGPSAHHLQIPLEMKTAPVVMALRRRLNCRAVRLNLIDLWEWDMRRNFGAPADPIVIEDAADWTGKRGAFVEACLSLGLLRRADQGLVVVPWRQMFRDDWTSLPVQDIAATVSDDPETEKTTSGGAFRMRILRGARQAKALCEAAGCVICDISDKGHRHSDACVRHIHPSRDVTCDADVRHSDSESVTCDVTNARARTDPDPQPKTDPKSEEQKTAPLRSVRVTGSESAESAAKDAPEPESGTRLEDPSPPPPAPEPTPGQLFGIAGGKQDSKTPPPRAPKGPRKDTPRKQDAVTPSGETAETWEHYRTNVSPRALCTKERADLIARWLQPGKYSVADLKRCIDGYRHSPFHQGENEQGRKYLDLELMLRDAKHIEAGMEMPDHPRQTAQRGRSGQADATYQTDNDYPELAEMRRSAGGMA